MVFVMDFRHRNRARETGDSSKSHFKMFQQTSVALAALIILMESRGAQKMRSGKILLQEDYN